MPRVPATRRTLSVALDESAQASGWGEEASPARPRVGSIPGYRHFYHTHFTSLTSNEIYVVTHRIGLTMPENNQPMVPHIIFCKWGINSSSSSIHGCCKRRRNEPFQVDMLICMSQVRWALSLNISLCQKIFFIYGGNPTIAKYIAVSKNILCHHGGNRNIAK